MVQNNETKIGRRDRGGGRLGSEYDRYNPPDTDMLQGVDEA